MVSRKFAKFEASQAQIQGTLRGLVDQIGTLQNASASIETIDSKFQALEKKADDAIIQVYFVGPLK